MPVSKNRPPKNRDGYRWEWRDGCDCENCPWCGNCRGETWEHWIEVKDDQPPNYHQGPGKVELVRLEKPVAVLRHSGGIVVADVATEFYSGM
jgi:hypothetical protein